MPPKLRRLSRYSWEIPRDYKPGMLVPGIVFADERLLEQIRADECLEQVANGAFLPGIVRASLAMPSTRPACRRGRGRGPTVQGFVKCG